MKRILLVLALAVGLLSSHNSSAKHVVGGNWVVTWISDSTYVVRLHVYRDCFSNGADLPFQIDFSFYEASNHSIFPVYDKSGFLSNLLQLPQISQQNVTLGDDCYTPSNICVEEGIYEDTVMLPDYNGTLYLACEIFSRNESITNLVNPGDVGMTFYAEIPDRTFQNSSPDFGPYPNDGYMCVGFQNSIKIGATDPDGDSIVFKLIDPLDGVVNLPGQTTSSGPFSAVPWQASYGVNNMVGGTPPLTINPQTGEIICRPNMAGLFVVAVVAEEYRNGVKIGEMRRDVQLTAIADCDLEPKPEILSIAGIDANAGGEIEIYVDTLLCFDLMAKGESYNDSLVFQITTPLYEKGMTIGQSTDTFQTNPHVLLEYTIWDKGVFIKDTAKPNIELDSVTFMQTGAVGAKICWQPTCEDMGQTLPIKIRAYKNSTDTCKIADTTQVEFDVIVRDRPDVVPNFLMKNAIPTIYVNEQSCFDLSCGDADWGDSLFFTIESDVFNRGATLGASPSGVYQYDTGNGVESFNRKWTDQKINTALSNDSTYHLEGIDTIATQICWSPGCEDVGDTVKVTVHAFSVSPCGDTTKAESRSIDVLIAERVDIPPSILGFYAAKNPVKVGNGVCWDIGAADTNKGDEVHLEITSSTFNLGATTEVRDGNEYEFWETNQDWYTYDASNQTKTTIPNGFRFSDTDTVATRFCWNTACEHLTDSIVSIYRLSITTYSVSICGDTARHSDYPVEMDIVVHPDVDTGDNIIPNIFTPNGDSINDLFYIPGLYDPCNDNLTIKIYNRWGTLVYESSSSIFVWDGKSKGGVDMPEGTYFVVMEGSKGTLYPKPSYKAVPNMIDKNVFTVTLKR